MANYEAKSEYKLMNYFFRLIPIIMKRNGPRSLIPLGLGLFGKNNPHKECIEQIAAHYHLFKYIRTKYNYQEFLDDQTTLCICHGSGKTPRDAYFFAGTTKWNVISIDPTMDSHYIENTYFDNLKCIKGITDDMEIPAHQTIILIGVHSHADFMTLWNKFNNAPKRIALSIPCCGKQYHKVQLEPVIDIYEEEFPTANGRNNQILIWDV